MTILILLIMGLSASAASLFLKKSTANGIHIWQLLKCGYFYLGGILYVVAALLNLYLLKILPYSVVIPLGSLTYIWTLLLSHRFLGESITRQKLVAIVFILLGVLLIAM